MTRKITRCPTFFKVLSTATSDDLNNNPRTMIAGDIATVRFPFASLGVNERYEISHQLSPGLLPSCQQVRRCCWHSVSNRFYFCCCSFFIASTVSLLSGARARDWERAISIANLARSDGSINQLQPSPG